MACFCCLRTRGRNFEVCRVCFQIVIAFAGWIADLSVPRIQIVTIEQALALRDRAVWVPLVQASHKRAAREVDATRQGAMDL